MIQRVLTVFLAIFCVEAGAIYYLIIRECGQEQTSTPTGSPLLSNVAVYFIDVDQGDSIFIDMSNRDMLIDGLTENSGNTVVKFFRDLGIINIDFVVVLTLTLII